jgi:hypothetical protein
VICGRPRHLLAHLLHQRVGQLGVALGWRAGRCAPVHAADQRAHAGRRATGWHRPAAAQCASNCHQRPSIGADLGRERLDASAALTTTSICARAGRGVGQHLAHLAAQAASA